MVPFHVNRSCPRLLTSPSSQRDTSTSKPSTLRSPHESASISFHSTYLSLCFHTLTHSFASAEILSPIFSISSALFAQNTRGGYPAFLKGSSAPIPRGATN